MNKIDLEDRHAVVTGGASGLGRAAAERLLASGAHVTIWDASAEALESALGTVDGFAGRQVDVRDANAIEAAVAAAAPIDILVNSAGINGANVVSWEMPPDDWERVIDINLNGLFRCCRAVVPGMIARDYGRIVNVASVAGKEGNPKAAQYSASKGGVIAFTKSLGKELAGTEIRVNCITPAAIETPLFDQVSPEHVAYMKSKIPLGRFGLPGEFAAMVAWMASEECSFSTGSVFDLSGGRSTY